MADQKDASFRQQHTYLAKINEQHVLHVIRDVGPRSRAELARQTRLSAPTVSKAAASLLKARFLEEIDANGEGLGRPAPKLRLNTESAQVLGVVIDVNRSTVVATGLDGTLSDARTRHVQTNGDYEALIAAVAEHAQGLMARPGVQTLGVGVTVPGMVDHRRNLHVLASNLHAIDGRSPGHDLGERLGIDCLMLQDQHALCMAERLYGRARGLDDFVFLDVSTGVGMGVMSGGRLVRGHSGFAGEIGHITVAPDGSRCGCGNRGCLETVACDTAVARQVSRRLRRRLDIGEIVRQVRGGEIDCDRELKDFVHYLAIGLAAVINVFNPSTLFLHGQVFDADDRLLPRLLEQTSKRALAPSFKDCRVIRAQGSLRQGAVAGIIEHLIESVVPELRA
jgi:predicted NBD/HSP70 family sugar kinase